jgi:hypothetical protein
MADLRPEGGEPSYFRGLTCFDVAEIWRTVSGAAASRAFSKQDKSYSAVLSSVTPKGKATLRAMKSAESG